MKMLLMSEKAVCKKLGIEPTELRRWIEIGLVRRVRRGNQFGFERQQLLRMRSIMNLQYNLEINAAGIRLILELVDQVHQLRAMLEHADRRLEHACRLNRYRSHILELQLGRLEWEVDL